MEEKLIYLYDESSDWDGQRTLCWAAGKGTWEKFKDIYYKARDEWYRDCNQLPALWEHIQERLEQNGFTLSAAGEEIPELDF